MSLTVTVIDDDQIVQLVYFQSCWNFKLLYIISFNFLSLAVSDTDDDQIVQLSDKLKASENGRDTAVLHVAMGYLALQTKKLIQAKDHLLQGILVIILKIVNILFVLSSS